MSGPGNWAAVSCLTRVSQETKNQPVSLTGGLFFVYNIHHLLTWWWFFCVPHDGSCAFKAFTPILVFSDFFVLGVWFICLFYLILANIIHTFWLLSLIFCPFPSRPCSMSSLVPSYSFFQEVGESLQQCCLVFQFSQLLFQESYNNILAKCN